MASFRNLALFATFLLFVVNTSFVTSSKSQPDLQKVIKDICKDTNDNKKCMYILTTDPKAVQAKTVMDLVNFTLKLGEDYARRNVRFYKRKLAQLTQDASLQGMKKTLDTCLEGYERIDKSFPGAKTEMESDYDLANYDVMLSFDEIRICTEVLGSATGSPEMINDITRRNKKMSLYVALAAGATNALPPSDDSGL